MKRWLSLPIAALLSLCVFAGCSGGTDAEFVNPGDKLGGGGEATTTPVESDSENKQSAVDTAGALPAGEEAVPSGAQAISGGATIEEPGDYVIDAAAEGKISVACDGVTLYLQDASLTNAKKVIESDFDLTITLLGENSVSNTNEEGSNAIDCAGDLLLNGSGSLTISATKNAVKAASIRVAGATLYIDAAQDGLHAEVDAYDDAYALPTPSYDDGGYVCLDGAAVTIDAGGDGIQADTFIYITGESAVNITAGGGAPATITASSSDSASGKGIKAGPIDWGEEGADLDWDGYLLYVESGTISVDANDDALHSDGELVIEGGAFALASGDDAVHADDLLQICGGEIAIDRCFEGVESAKVEILSGTLEVRSYEDGINAADGSQAPMGASGSDCHILIAGGYVSVDCIGSEGDGIDANGTILITGGEVYVAGSAGTGDAALDADGGILVNGGYLFAVGPLGMVETPASNSEQCCVSYAHGSDIAAGTTLYLCDGEGTVLLYMTAPRSCRSVILSAPALTAGESYSLYGGDTLLTTFTVNATITTLGSNASIMLPGGAPNGMRPGSGTPGFGNAHR